MPMQQARASAKGVHRIARLGFEQSGSSGLYDRARPSYPPEIIDRTLAASQGRGPQRIVELGPGTGISTRLLLEAGHRFGGIARFLGFDISEGMLQYLDASMLGSEGKPGFVQQLQERGALPRDLEFRTERGDFNSFDAPGENDLVVIAQAYHWCPDFHQSLEHIASKLRPGGMIALMWNIEDRDAASWVGQVRDLYEVYEDGTPQYRHMLWRALYDTPAYKQLFDEVDELHITRSIPTTMELLLERIRTKSYVSLLDAPTRERLLDRVQDLFAQQSDTQLGRQWLDKDTGVWAYPYRTDLHLLRRK